MADEYVVLGGLNTEPNATIIQVGDFGDGLVVEAGLEGTAFTATSNNGVAVRAKDTQQGDAVVGSTTGAGTGVAGSSESGSGVSGSATGGGVGVSGQTEGGDSGVGVGGYATGAGTGVEGYSDSGVAVSALSDTHWAVSARSNHDTAVQAQSMAGIGVVGVGTASGVYGQSGSTDGFALTRDGVRGYTDSGTDSGLRGENAAGGNGVSGVTTSASGNGKAAVDGTNSGTGPGVRGAGGIGVLAQATGNGATALEVQGPAVFSRSGLLTVAAGQSSATVTGVTLSAASLVLATLQQHATGLYILAAVPNVPASSLSVYLSKTVAAAVQVAWFVVN